MDYLTNQYIEYGSSRVLGMQSIVKESSEKLSDEYNLYKLRLDIQEKIKKLAEVDKYLLGHQSYPFVKNNPNFKAIWDSGAIKDNNGVLCVDSIFIRTINKIAAVLCGSTSALFSKDVTQD